MIYNNFIKNCSHYGDILAIPFFALLVIYFYNIEHKSTIENVLLYFSIAGFVLDILFTYIFLSDFKSLLVLITVITIIAVITVITVPNKPVLKDTAPPLKPKTPYAPI